MKALLDVNVSLKRVFLRADLDVPVEKTQVLESATRLHNLRDTVGYLLEHSVNQIIIAGHIDRPEKPDPALSTKQLLGPLKKILGQDIAFKDNFESNAEGKVVLFENLRFWSGETACEEDFAKKLSGMADVYVNEAFGNCHRNHASMIGVPKLLPHAAGVHLEKEVEVLTHLLKNPQRPFVAIVGGAKVETKIPVIENSAKVADWVLIGGAIAKELKIENGKLKIDESKIIVANSEVSGNDIDSKSIDKFKEVISTAKTIVWNGPMGVFEEGFEKGTLAVVEAISQTDAYKVVGGGETTQFLEDKNLNNKFSFISAGGGAMLEFLAGKELLALKELE